MESAFQGVRLVQGLSVTAKKQGLMPKPKSFQVVTGISNLRSTRRKSLLAGRTIGFVPTMGALHEGHLNLIRQAARENNFVYVSIYVNPTQFGVNEDLQSYPRTWESDQEKLRELCVELSRNKKVGQLTTVFMPETRAIYPGLPPTSEIDGEGSFVTITPLSKILEGASRPVFFRGVATVCMKLLNIVQPEKVYFGQKDIQQTFVVKRMVKDFHLDTEVRVCPTVREPDGLALSSRNVYLGIRRRRVAIVLLAALKAAQQAYAKGGRTRSEVLTAAFGLLSATQESQRKLPPEEQALFEVDYISLADADTLAELDQVEKDGAILSGAIKMLPLEASQEGEDTGVGGGTSPVRLIDNIYLDVFSSVIGKIG